MQSDSLKDFDVVTDQDGLVVSVNTLYTLDDLAMEQTIQPTEGSFGVPFKWDNDRTDFMLHLYNQLINSIGPNKRFRTKKLLWHHISARLNQTFDMKLTARQVETRYKCILKRKKKPITGKHNINIFSKEETLYEEEEHSQSESQSECIGIGTDVKPDKPYRIRKSLQEMMFQNFFKQKDEHFQLREEARNIRARERQDFCRERHKEKMQFIRDMFVKIDQHKWNDKF